MSTQNLTIRITEHDWNDVEKYVCGSHDYDIDIEDYYYYYTSAHGSGRRYYILLLKFLFLFFLSSQDLRDGSTDREPF